MELIVGELYAMRKPLANLLETEVPVKAAFCLSRLVKQIEEGLRSVELDRNALVRKLGVVDSEESKPDNEVWKVPPENQDAFDKELSELFSREISIEFTPVPLSTLDGAKIMTGDMMLMEKLFVDE